MDLWEGHVQASEVPSEIVTHLERVISSEREVRTGVLSGTCLDGGRGLQQGGEWAVEGLQGQSAL